ncbi:MAG: O-acetyl-ADP-ribose deacetylase [Gammaproteobacteria bacterium]
MQNKLKIIQGDITQLSVDAIVNAANEALLAGAGVCGAIHHAAGPKLLEECMSVGGCPTGDARITKGYDLPANYVIHAVGPVWHGGQQNEARLLASCYTQSLKLALQHQLKTLAFPAISCGIFGYPVDQAAKIAVNTVSEFLKTHTEIDTVYFVCFDKTIYDAYQHALSAQNHDK